MSSEVERYFERYIKNYAERYTENHYHMFFLDGKSSSTKILIQRILNLTKDENGNSLKIDYFINDNNEF